MSIRGIGSFAGFESQARREIASWWTTGRWRRQALLWTLLLVGILVSMVWVLPPVLSGLEGGDALQVDVTEAALQFTDLIAAMTAVGAAILGQGVLIDDRRSGVMEWVLSKPLSRTALISSKFIGLTSGVLVSVVTIPWIGVGIVFSIARGSIWPVGWWLVAVLLIALLVMFQIALVMALSTVAWSRGLVLGVPLALVVGSDLITATLPWFANVNPYLLGKVGGAMLSGGELLALGPVVAAVVGTIGLLGFTALRFNSHEF